MTADPLRIYQDYLRIHQEGLEGAIANAVRYVMAERVEDPISAVGRMLLGAPPVPPASRLPRSGGGAGDGPIEQEAWSAAKWLDTLGVNGIVADHLVAAAGGDELAALRQLARATDVRTAVRARLASSLEPLVDVLTPVLQELCE